MTDSDADEISERIQAKHLVYGFIAETQFMSPSSEDIRWTQGNGDGAIWTGTYLAAEAFRHAVTKSATALKYVTDALERVRDLAFAAPSGFLARTIFPLDSPFIAKFVADEEHSGLFPINYRGKDSYWLGHPTRDQYAGVFLGLGVTYDLVDKTALKSICTDTITHLVDALLAHHWTMGNPGHPLQETFLTYPSHMLSILQLAKHVNPARFGSIYDHKRGFLSLVAGISLQYDIWNLRKHSYLLNLDFCYYYNLIRYETDPQYKNRYLKQFARLKEATRDHRNAHFNMIDCALTGLDADRDQETVESLEAILGRRFRSDFVLDPTQESKPPLPVNERPYADFLWQRSPFGIRTAGDASLESPGIDFILPYWMARYHDVIAPSP